MSRRWSPPALVGRERESETLAAVCERGGALVVRGEAGVGKSALLAEAARSAAERGTEVLRASGVESEANLPFAGLHQLLRPLLGEMKVLPIAQREALLAAFGMGRATAPPEIFLIGLASLDLLTEHAARCPLLLLIEDAHWLDDPSCDVLAFVARRVELDPIAILIAVRSGFDRFADGSITELDVGGLDDSAAAELLDATAPGLAPDLRRRVLEAAVGNPLALVELPTVADAAEAREPLPLTERLEYAFASRLTDLPIGARIVLLAAALEDGRELRESLEAASAVLGARAKASDLKPAVASNLVTVDDNAVRFRHPLVRSALVGAATPEELRAMHAALADALGEDADRRAWHVAGASDGPNESAAGLLEEAATRAQQRGGLRAAATALRHASSLTPDARLRARRLFRAAELAFEAGRPDLLGELLREVEALDVSALDRGRVALVRELADAGSREHPLTEERVLALVELARDATGKAGDDDLALSLLWSAASRCYWTDPGQETRLRLVAAAEALAAADTDPRVIGILAFAAPVERGAFVVERLSQVASSGGARDGRAARLLGGAAHAVGAFDLAAAFFADGVADLRAEGRLALLARALVLQSRSALHLGQLAAAVAAAAEGGRLAEETGEPLFDAGGKIALAIVDAMRGDDGKAEARLADAEALALPFGAGASLASAQFARGLAALGAGRHQDAYDQLRRMFDPADAAFHTMESSWALGDLAEAAVRADRPEGARALLLAHEPFAAQTPAARVQISLRYARALLADDDRAESLYNDALDAPLAIWPFDRARLLLAYGAWLRRQRRVAESRTPLRTAAQAFDALGAAPWSDRAHQELRASGETTRTRRVELRDQLSPQELQIARMAADGLTNRQIGQQLYLSHRTVGSHLYRLFPKLGITSRNQLRAALEG